MSRGPIVFLRYETHDGITLAVFARKSGDGDLTMSREEVEARVTSLKPKAWPWQQAKSVLRNWPTPA